MCSSFGDCSSVLVYDGPAEMEAHSTSNALELSKEKGGIP